MAHRPISRAWCTYPSPELGDSGRRGGEGNPRTLSTAASRLSAPRHRSEWLKLPAVLSVVVLSHAPGHRPVRTRHFPPTYPRVRSAAWSRGTLLHRQEARNSPLGQLDKVSARLKPGRPGHPQRRVLPARAHLLDDLDGVIFRDVAA